MVRERKDKLSVPGLADIDISREFEEIPIKLERLGLSSYEARAYMALVAHGYGDANTIATTGRIPRTSAYKVLQRLKDKGFANATSGRPVIFKPEPPAEIKQKFSKEMDAIFERLELLHEIVRTRGEPHLIFTITDTNKVFEKMGEMLDTTTRTFFISTPIFREIRENLGKKLANAIQRGIEITVITAPGQKVPQGVKVTRKTSLLATDIISDGQRAIIASPDLTACGYTDNEILAAHVERFLKIMIKD